MVNSTIYNYWEEKSELIMCGSMYNELADKANKIILSLLGRYRCATIYDERKAVVSFFAFS
jgi:hypothetical protein